VAGEHWVALRVWPETAIPMARLKPPPASIISTDLVQQVVQSVWPDLKTECA